MIEPGIYRHFKGTFYNVLMMGQDSELREAVVIYQSTVDSKVWVRSLENWNTPVAGKPRFRRVPRIGSKHRHNALRTVYELRGFEDSCAGINSMVVYRLLTDTQDYTMPLEDFLAHFTTVEG